MAHEEFVRERYIPTWSRTEHFVDFSAAPETEGINQGIK